MRTSGRTSPFGSAQPRRLSGEDDGTLGGRQQVSKTGERKNAPQGRIHGADRVRWRRRLAPGAPNPSRHYFAGYDVAQVRRPRGVTGVASRCTDRPNPGPVLQRPVSGQRGETDGGRGRGLLREIAIGRTSGCRGKGTYPVNRKVGTVLTRSRETGQ